MVQSIFEVPDFVKTASAEALDPSVPDAVVVGKKYRIDTKAGAWVASADIRKQAMAGNETPSDQLRSVNMACSLFNITDADFVLRRLPGEHIIVKSASDSAEFHIGSDEQFEDSVQELLLKRASYPLPFCRDCANKLLDLQDSGKYTLSKEASVDLTRLAGTCHFNSSGAAREVRKRADYALNNNHKDYAERMYKLASMCEQLSEDSSFLLTSSVTDAVDVFDQKFHLLNKLASYGMERIENVAFMTAKEALEKSASDAIQIDDERSVPRSSFMIESTRHEMAKWASMNGYTTTEEPRDIIDCVAAMPDSLRADFCEIFAGE